MSIKFDKDSPMQRGKPLWVEMTVTDVLSLLEGLAAGQLHFQHRGEELEADSELRAMCEARANDARINIDELYKVLEDRDKQLQEAEDPEPTEAQLERLNNADSGGGHNDSDPTYRAAMYAAGRGRQVGG